MRGGDLPRKKGGTMAFTEGLDKRPFVGVEITDMEYDPEKDVLTITTKYGAKLVVNVGLTPGADGGMYHTLHMITFIGG